MAIIAESPAKVQPLALPPYFKDWEQWFEALRTQYGRFTEASRRNAVDEVYAYWEADDCDHDPEVVYQLASNGSKMFTHQCRYCWKRMAQWLPQNTLTDHQIDAALRVADSQDRWAATEGPKLHMLNTINLEAKSEHRSDYTDYLRSPEWREIRRLVLERDNHTCQGCIQHTATDVHHLTYDHVRNEFMFELISLCPECHARVHAIQS